MPVKERNRCDHSSRLDNHRNEENLNFYVKRLFEGIHAICHEKLFVNVDRLLCWPKIRAENDA